MVSVLDGCTCILSGLFRPGGSSVSGFSGFWFSAEGTRVDNFKISSSHAPWFETCFLQDSTAELSALLDYTIDDGPFRSATVALPFLSTRPVQVTLLRPSLVLAGG